MKFSELRYQDPRTNTYVGSLYRSHFVDPARVDQKWLAGDPNLPRIAAMCAESQVGLRR